MYIVFYITSMNLSAILVKTKNTMDMKISIFLRNGSIPNKYEKSEIYTIFTNIFIVL